jgi:hypothetical protein
MVLDYHDPIMTNPGSQTGNLDGDARDDQFDPEVPDVRA